MTLLTQLIDFSLIIIDQYSMLYFENYLITDQINSNSPPSQENNKKQNKNMCIINNNINDRPDILFRGY